MGMSPMWQNNIGNSCLSKPYKQTQYLKQEQWQKYQELCEQRQQQIRQHAVRRVRVIGFVLAMCRWM